MVTSREVIIKQMATLLEQINDGWKAAMKSGETLRKDTLSGLRAAVKRSEIDARTSGEWNNSDEEVQGVIEREAKKRRDAIDEYEKAGRPDRADAERAELAILQEFLPAQLTNEELEAIVREEVEKSGASGPAAMGALMKAVMPRVQGRADGKQVNAIVRQLLG
jgi:uncharacterized protein YqeY